ncbi:MAG TPA: DUF167 family protein [Rhodocyclaceae bacterium]|nr:DUF167 family protein [Rhodocyclaceae bacterium]
MSVCWLRSAGEDVLLTLHIQPGAKKTEVAGQHGEALKVRLGAPPVDGKANDCLIAFLAERLDIPKSRVVLESGTTSRSKRVRVVGIAAAMVVERLNHA